MKSEFHNWSDIRVFLSVIRNGSTLAASKELGLAQPTVARRIEALEHCLRLTLFERDTRGFQPTLEAGALVEYAEAIEASTTAFAAEARCLRSNDAPIRLTAAGLNFAETFEVILQEFSAKHPDVRFEIIATDRRLDLLAGEADVAVRHSQSFDDGNLICRKLSVGTFSLYASKSYVEKYGAPASEDEFRDHRFIVPEGDHMPDQVSAWMREQLDPDQIAMTCNEWMSLVTAVYAGIGIAPMAMTFGGAREDLVRCADLPESTSYQTMLLVSPQAYRRPEVKTFTAFFAPRYTALARAQKEALD